jgi:hypothetical protein
MERFELSTPCSRSRCATRLRYIPSVLRMDADLSGDLCDSRLRGSSLDRCIDLDSLAEIPGGLPVSRVLAKAERYT